MAVFSGLGATVNIAVTGTAQTLTLTAPPTNAPTTVRLVNIGTQTVFVRFDGVTAVATTAAPLVANSIEVFDMGSVTTLSVIAAATGSTLYATTGLGE